MHTYTRRAILGSGTGAPIALTSLVPRHYTPGLVAPFMTKSVVVMLVLVLGSQTLLPVIASAQEQMPAASPGQAVAKGLRLMRAKGWTPTNTPVIKQVVSPSVRVVDNGSMTDGGVTISWQSWDDGNPVTWEGVVTLAGPTGDIQSYVQQINLANGDPVVTYQVLLYATAPPVRDRRVQSHECPACPISGTAVPRVAKYPDFKSFYKCGALGCGIAAVIALIPLFPVVSFFGGCTAALIRCAFGRLWRWDDSPGGD